ncbi:MULTISPECIES: glycosyltransferase family 2 protein [Kordiimonas]|jgi:glycosyltransferase involved in cell wall biosynthesis|uniref:glycosyltransferase family 2 protein n=1 Tax=Kordiimonas TaxID=288021 RepID=UPI00257CA70D|nr:glycosyltransferase family 2 protein [Kordiimonas sp. UBA4487]
MARVTVVIATHNRPALLRRTIQSVLNQTVKDWVLLVVGDCCGPETGEVISAFDDERIFYVNLEERCGEQGGPNTAGMYAAQTEYVALANHDDIWLPDHLEIALKRLEKEGADFLCSAAAISVEALDASTGKMRFGFRGRSPEGRSFKEGFAMGPVYFEPVSCWVFRSDLLHRVGAWRPATNIYRTPLEDWILRAWRADAAIVFEDTVTAIYCFAEKTFKQGKLDKTDTYLQESTEQEYWLDLLANEDLAVFRRRVDRDVSILRQSADLFSHTFEKQDDFWIFEALQNDQTTRLYKEKGWDGFAAACNIIGLKPGFRIKRLLQHRTGETLPVRKDWKSVAHFVKDALATDARWNKGLSE